jgi:hypothetical protein
MREPADYLAEVEAKHPGVLQSQWIPNDPALWQVDRYADFLAARRELLAGSAQAFLDSLRNPDTPHNEAALEPLQVAPEATDDPRAEQLRGLIEELRARGLAEPDVDTEIADPATGAELAVPEAFWPEGLQTGLGDPVVLELDPQDADLPRLEELGYKVFTSVDALLGYVESESLTAAGEPSADSAEPLPVNPIEGDAEAEFGRRMTHNLARSQAEAKSNPVYPRSMLAQLGPLPTARKLLAAPAVSDVFAALWERGRMDLTSPRPTD